MITNQLFVSRQFDWIKRGDKLIGMADKLDLTGNGELRDIFSIKSLKTGTVKTFCKKSSVSDGVEIISATYIEISKNNKKIEIIISYY